MILIVKNTIRTICFALLCANSSPAEATQVLEMSLETMVKKAQVIVIGTVSSVQSTAVPEARGRIHTVVSLSPIQRIKSPEKAVKQKGLQFVVPGGVVGRIGQQVAGAPKFKAGERILVLLEEQPQSHRLLIVGFVQGLYRIVPATKLMPEQAISDRSGVTMVMRNPRGDLVSSNRSSMRHEQRLTSLLSRIKKQLVPQP